MESTVTIDVCSFDVGLAANTAADVVEAVARRVEQSWNSGADIVLLPEYTWLALQPLVAAGLPEREALRALSRVFWEEVLPSLSERLTQADKTAVLGTCPYWDAAAGELVNRAPILAQGRWLHQDKLHLTPWEDMFAGGRELLLWRSHGLLCAVVICLDIEVPELSASLRGRGVDLIMCPSATETLLGVERVDRCASARAVELGCHVAVAHLVGRSPAPMIDDNIGRVALYHPSQSPFAGGPRWIEGGVHRNGSDTLRAALDADCLRRMRDCASETNPALLDMPRAGDGFTVRPDSAFPHHPPNP